MTKDELIAKQQLQIENLNINLKKNESIVKALKGRFYSIGQPLNDNILKFNKEQLTWCIDIFYLIEEIKY